MAESMSGRPLATASYNLPVQGSAVKHNGFSFETPN